MIMQVVGVDEAKFEKILGGYNDPLPNMVELTPEEFAQSSFFTYSVDYIGYRQIDPRRLPENIKCKFFMPIKYFINKSDLSGYAMYQEYHEKRVRFFKFTPCVHDWRYPTDEDFAKGCPRPAMCFHVSICTKCGQIECVDSSD